MPKYGIHHIVVTDAIGTLMASTSTTDKAIASLMGANMGFSNAGAIGPDLFFWAPDYEIVHKMYPFYKTYKDLVDLYNTIVTPIREVIDTIKDGAETVAPATVGILEALLREVRETVGLFTTTASQGLFAGMISGANLITDAIGFPSLSASFFDDMFKPGLQKGEPLSQWYWFDMLHYRRTGELPMSTRWLAGPTGCTCSGTSQSKITWTSGNTRNTTAKISVPHSPASSIYPGLCPVRWRP
jgi:hypothetical protein